MPQSPGAAAATFYGWTVIQLVLMALGAAVVIAGMIYGRHLARQRHRAQRAAEERVEEAGLEVPPATEPTAVETRAEPVAEEPDTDLSVVAEPASKPAPAPKPAPAQEAPPELELAPPPPAPVPAPVEVVPSSPPPAAAPNLAGALTLTTIKGLGPKVAAMLAERGITQVDQLAALTPDQARELDVQLGAFTGRMERDRWIDQAQLLASGNTAAYEAEFGRLG